MDLIQLFEKYRNMPVNENAAEFKKVREQYEEMFGHTPGTEMSIYTIEEWIDILKECIENKKALPPEDYGDDDDDIDY